jgi:hypothetical protein
VSLTAEQQLILAKFSTPIADDYLDGIKREASQHPPARARIVTVFCKSVESAMLVASIPFQLTVSAINQSIFARLVSAERIRALKKVNSGEELTEVLETEALDIATEHYKKHQASEEGRLQLTDGVIRNLGHFLDMPEGRVAGPELLSQTVVMLWGALEALVSDVIRHEMNATPMLAIRVASTDPSRKHFNNRLTLDQLATRNFNLERSMGDALLADRSLDSLPVIRDVLTVLAADDAPVHKAFADANLWKLWQVRHLIVHRRGQVDQAYIDRTGDDRWSVGRLIKIDSAYVDEATALIRDAALAFLQSWHTPRPS